MHRREDQLQASPMFEQKRRPPGDTETSFGVRLKHHANVDLYAADASLEGKSMGGDGNEPQRDSVFVTQ